MKCDKCLQDFAEKDLECSHDIPKYMGGKDINGRHNLCKKCHDIYEKTIFFVAFKTLSNEQKIKCKQAVKKFSIKYFKKEDDTKTITG